MPSASTNAGISSTSTALPHSIFDGSKRIASVAPFSDTEVDSYFGTF